MRPCGAPSMVRRRPRDRYLPQPRTATSCSARSALTLGTTLNGWAHERTTAELRAGRCSTATDPATSLPCSSPSCSRRLRRSSLFSSRSRPRRPRACSSNRGCHLRPLGRSGPRRGDQLPRRGLRRGGRPRHTRVLSSGRTTHRRRSAAGRAHGVGGVSIEHFLLSEPLGADTAEIAGLSVNTGTINSVELLERALAFEPDGVCTDRPHGLHAEALAAAS